MQIRRSWIWFQVVAAGSLGCSSNGPTTPPDRTPPFVQIVFPNEGSFDRDGDGLVDIEVQLSDSGAGIDPAAVEIISSRPSGPAGGGGVDLFQTFRVVSRDSTRIVLEETTSHLLPDGGVQIIARVRDRSGNPRQDSRSIDLPAGAFYTRLPTPAFHLPPVGIEIVAEDSIGFVIPDDGPEVIPFDPYRLEVLPAVSTGGVVGVFEGEYYPFTHRLYLVSINEGRVAVIDPATLQAEAPIPISGRGVAIEQSASGLLYVSLSLPHASVSVVDPAARRELRVVRTGIVDSDNPGHEAFIGAVQVPRDNGLIYIPLLVDPGGVLIVEDPTGDVVARIDLQERKGGLAQDSALDLNRGLIYFTNVRELDAFDINSNTVVRRIEAQQVIPGVDPETVVTKFLSLSPSGDRLFVTVGTDIDRPHESWLVDLPTFTVIERFFPSHPDGENGSVFRPDGQLIFAASGDAINVYLNRE